MPLVIIRLSFSCRIISILPVINPAKRNQFYMIFTEGVKLAALIRKSGIIHSLALAPLSLPPRSRNCDSAKIVGQFVLTFFLGEV
jgi:hypothetical protein